MTYLKTSCGICSQEVEFPEHGLGQTISCPACNEPILLSVSAVNVEKQPPRESLTPLTPWIKNERLSLPQTLKEAKARLIGGLALLLITVLQFAFLYYISYPAAEKAGDSNRAMGVQLLFILVTLTLGLYWFGSSVIAFVRQKWKK